MFKLVLVWIKNILDNNYSKYENAKDDRNIPIAILRFIMYCVLIFIIGFLIFMIAIIFIHLFFNLLFPYSLFVVLILCFGKLFHFFLESRF